VSFSTDPADVRRSRRQTDSMPNENECQKRSDQAVDCPVDFFGPPAVVGEGQRARLVRRLTWPGRSRSPVAAIRGAKFVQHPKPGTERPSRTSQLAPGWWVPASRMYGSGSPCRTLRTSHRYTTLPARSLGTQIGLVLSQPPHRPVESPSSSGLPPSMLTSGIPATSRKGPWPLRSACAVPPGGS
jgi:hypothetical protein